MQCKYASITVFFNSVISEGIMMLEDEASILCANIMDLM